MDQWSSTVLVAMITMVGGIITAIIQKKQSKMIKKIDKQTLFIEKEKNIKKKLVQKEKENEIVIHDIMLLILDTNLSILTNAQLNIPDEEIKRVLELASTLKGKYTRITEEIEDINKEYEIILNMSDEIQKELGATAT